MTSITEENPSSDQITDDKDSSHQVLTTENNSSSLDQLIFTIDNEIGLSPTEILTQELFQPSEDEMASLLERYVVFVLGDTRFAVKIENVIAIVSYPNITTTPNVPPWIRGVANLRGNIVSVVDLGIYQGIKEVNQKDSSRMLVIRVSDDSLITGLLVDQVNQILSISKELIETPTASVEGKILPYVHGVFELADDIIVVLDLEKFLRSTDMTQFV